LEELRDGTLAEPVPVMMDGSTFVVHGDTRSFWVKLWHSSPEQTHIERVQVISCLPSTRGMQVIFDEPDELGDEDEYDDVDDRDELDDEHDDDVDEPDTADGHVTPRE